MVTGILEAWDPFTFALSDVKNSKSILMGSSNPDVPHEVEEYVERMSRCLIVRAPGMIVTGTAL